MPPDLAIAILAGLGGMLGWGFADFFAKKTIDQIGDIASLAWGHVFGTLVIAGVAAWHFAGGGSLSFPDTASGWLGIALFGAGQAAIYGLVYRGFGKGQVAILNPVFASFTSLVALVSIVVFREQVGGGVVAGLVATAIGILLVSVDTSGLRGRRLGLARVPGLGEIGLATLGATAWTLGWDRFVGGQDWLAYALAMYVAMTVAILVAAWRTRTPLTVADAGVWKFLVLIGLGETLAYLALSYGYGVTTRTSVIALLSGAFSLPTIILARGFLGERINAAQTAGTLVIVAGIVLISAF